MKIKLFAILALIVVMCFPMAAQKSAGEYMDKVEETQRKISEDFLIYVSAVAHGKSARKVEKRRKELINAVSQGKNQAKHLAPFNKTDTTLKAAAFEYLTICYNLLKEDYGKIVDMEEIAEQSYDNMEAYMMAQEKANDKLHEAGLRLEAAQKQFAANNNITLIEKKDALSKKSEKVTAVNKYYNQLFLLYFKVVKQEAYLIADISKHNVGGIEQNKKTLLANCEEGLQKLSTIKGYEGDQSIPTACKKLILFYQKEANEKVPGMVAYYMKKDAFDKAKAAFDASGKTKADADSFNKVVKETNDATNAYNKTNNEMNQTREKLNNEWDNAVKTFMDRHIPQAS